MTRAAAPQRLRIALAVAWAGCAHPGGTSPASERPLIEVAGRVTAPDGSPIARAMVAICGCGYPGCPNRVVWDGWAHAESGSWSTPDRLLTHTDAAGRWSGRVATCKGELMAAISAPGRATTTMDRWKVDARPIDTVLAPEGTIEIDVPCVRASCPQVEAHVSSPTGGGYLTTAPAGAHQHMTVGRLATGSYVVRVYRLKEEPGEAVATTHVDVVEGRTTRVELLPTPTGTGKPLHGVLKSYAWLNEHEVFEVVASCGDELHRFHSRRAVIQAAEPPDRPFELEDIPPGRCEVNFYRRSSPPTVFDGPLCMDINRPDRDGVYMRTTCPVPHQCSPVGC